MCVFEGTKKLCEVRYPTKPLLVAHIDKIIASTPVFFPFSYKIKFDTNHLMCDI